MDCRQFQVMREGMNCVISLLFFVTLVLKRQDEEREDVLSIILQQRQPLLQRQQQCQSVCVHTLTGYKKVAAPYTGTHWPRKLAENMSAKVKLTYLYRHVTNDLCRLIMAAGDIQYEEVKVEGEEWQKLKPSKLFWLKWNTFYFIIILKQRLLLVDFQYWSTKAKCWHNPWPLLDFWPGLPTWMESRSWRRLKLTWSLITCKICGTVSSSMEPLWHHSHCWFQKCIVWSTPRARTTSKSKARNCLTQWCLTSYPQPRLCSEAEVGTILSETRYGYHVNEDLKIFQVILWIRSCPGQTWPLPWPWTTSCPSHLLPLECQVRTRGLRFPKSIRCFISWESGSTKLATSRRIWPPDRNRCFNL